MIPAKLIAFPTRKWKVIKKDYFHMGKWKGENAVYVEVGELNISITGSLITRWMPEKYYNQIMRNELYSQLTIESGNIIFAICDSNDKEIYRA